MSNQPTTPKPETDESPSNGADLSCCGLFDISASKHEIFALIAYHERDSEFWRSKSENITRPENECVKRMFHDKSVKGRIRIEQLRRKLTSNVSVHQIRPSQRTLTSSITFPPPVNQLPTSAVGFGWHVLFCTLITSDAIRLFGFKLTRDMIR